ncbi:MAG: metalloregulator ArsR/SmtB family transcription factor [Hyphomicrobiaceae bacterium]|nr:metalloregulator ArsR/SmtB family transcription factor [Hyphomicrobiaceae bacterium]
MSITFTSRELVAALKAAAEPTRLRVLRLLADGELNVKDLTHILGQSQPRLSRHLKLLTETGLVERFREGSWVYFHVSDRSHGGRLARLVLEMLDDGDAVVLRDRDRSSVLKRQREAAALRYFEAHAADWDRIRALHVPEAAVEAAIGEMIGQGPFQLLVDLGTGTGRMLELLSDRYEQAIGLDMSHAMLNYARSKLDRAGLERAQVRHGDIYNIALPDSSADAVIMHQVLHFLSDPLPAIHEAARVLAPGGRLLIVDFAPHEIEGLRESHAHERLGFPAEQVGEWLAAAGLDARATRTLEAPGPRPAEALGVSLWLGVRPSETAARANRTRKLEEAR